MLQRSNLSERRFRLCETNKDMAASYNKHCVNALLEPLFEIIGKAVYLSLAKPLMHNYKPRIQRILYIEALEAMLETMPDNPRTVKEKLKTGNSIVVIGVFTDSSDDHRVYAVYRNLTSESFHLFLKDGVSVLNISPFGQVTIDNGKIELLIGVIKIDELIGEGLDYHFDDTDKVVLSRRKRLSGYVRSLEIIDSISQANARYFEIMENYKK